MNVKHLIPTALCTLLLIFASATRATAQQIYGIVYELESSEKLYNVTIKNLRTGQTTVSDRDGQFTLAAELNDYLTFTQVGYSTDTAFYYEPTRLRVYLTRENNSILIDEVVVNKLTDSRLAAEIAKAMNEGKFAEISQHQGGLRLSPSRIFGKNAKLARKNLDLLITEQRNRKVDKQFTIAQIRALLPLKDDSIALFREQFRPSYEFIEKASPEEIRIYIMDAYKKFKNQ